MTAAEAQELVNAAKHYPHLKVMEAFMYRMHPQWQRARQLVKEGAVESYARFYSSFSYYLDDPTNIRNILDVGGGTMMVETRLHSTIESDNYATSSDLVLNDHSLRRWSYLFDTNKNGLRL